MKVRNTMRSVFKTNFKRQICIILCLVVLFASSMPVFAGNHKVSASISFSFKDVPKDFWAYDQIMWMLEKKFISGMGGDKFEPDGEISRDQFASMMVRTLDLDLFSPDTPSFVDVKKGNWAYSYVETARPYLTGFRTTNGDYFKPSQPAVREDMAVALVKALGYDKETIDENYYLAKFSDAGQINAKLRKYVALAVKYSLMSGYTQGNSMVFNPQGNLTRAQAATLLKKVYQVNEEKVTYDEEKVTYDGITYTVPKVTVNEEGSKLRVSWNAIGGDGFQGYKVVISKYDSTPRYPEDGYLFWITDKNQTSVLIDNTAAYNGGDFGGYLTKGQSYYFSVTAVYNNRNIPGNSVKKTYNGENNTTAYVKPRFSAAVENGRLVLRWDKIDSPKFQGYKIVISRNNTSPKYPDDGYLYWITDKNTTSAVIDNSTAYSGGDFGKYLSKGEKYYFNITAVYSDKKVSGDAQQIVYPGDDADALYPAPNPRFAVEGGSLVLRWDRINSAKFKAYAVSISKNDSTPRYPDNGYLLYTDNRDRTYAAIDNKTAYVEGDFGKYLVKGQKYYFTVTAVYDNRNVASTTLEYVYTGENNTDIYPKPVVSVDSLNGNTVVRWSRIDNVKFASYRVVISKYDTSPKYPDEGYLYEIKDSNTTYAVIDNSKAYTSGDFGGYLNKGERYYVSVTAEYTDRTVAGNAVRFLYEGAENPGYIKPSATVTEENGIQTLKWNRIESANFLGFRIVAAKNTADPKYPDNGYLPFTLDKSENFLTLSSLTKYFNSDFGGYLIKGETYNFKVIAVYKDRSVEGNVVQFKFTGADNPELFQKPVVTSTTASGILVLHWSRIDSPQLVGYRVTVSKNNTSPAYPANGFYKTLLDRNATSVVIDEPDALSGNSDVTSLVNNTEYHFSVTAVYNYDKYITSNVVTAKYIPD